MFDLLATNSAPAQSIEQKSNYITSPIGTSFPEYLAGIGQGELSAFAAILLYREAMPLFDAVDRRATAFSQIPVKVVDKRTRKPVDDHPILELLAAPNGDSSQCEFLESLSSYYDITGEAFLIATGNVSQPPLEIINRSPVNISFGALSSQFGLLNIPQSIFLNRATGNKLGTFNPVETPQSNAIRFYTMMDDKELWHLRRFNPLRTGGRFRGMSRAQPIWFELQQYISGNKSNLSFLKRGARPSLAWVNKTAGAEGELTPQQFERLQQEKQKYEGDINAGGVPILDGIEIQTFSQTNKDMEHKEMQDQMLARTFNTFRIPLALALDATMTLNNLETAMLHFFDDSVLPLANRLYDEMTRFLMPRYKGSENLMLTYNESDIPALRARMIAAAKEQNLIGVNSVDEIREMVGDEPTPGGEAILVPATLIPLGSSLLDPDATDDNGDNDDDNGDNDDDNGDNDDDNGDNDDGDMKSKAFVDFSRIMKQHKDDKGEPCYSDEAIIKMAIEGGMFNDT